MLKQIPNTLTIFRFALIVPFLFFLSQQSYRDAFYVFLIAGFTDGLDGWLARFYRCQSVFGSFMDPLADKLLIATSFISLALIGKLPWWLVLLVFLRDVTISFGVLAWYQFVQRKLNFRPTWISKFNTTFQLTLVTLCLFELAFFKVFPYLSDILIYLTAVTTSASYIDYVWTWGKRAWSSSHLVK